MLSYVILVHVPLNPPAFTTASLYGLPGRMLSGMRLVWQAQQKRPLPCLQVLASKLGVPSRIYEPRP